MKHFVRTRTFFVGEREGAGSYGFLKREMRQRTLPLNQIVCGIFLDSMVTWQNVGLLKPSKKVRVGNTIQNCCESRSAGIVNAESQQLVQPDNEKAKKQMEMKTGSVLLYFCYIFS